MIQSMNGLQFIRQLQHLLEDPDNTAFTVQEIGRAVQTAVGMLQIRLLPRKLHPNVRMNAELTPEPASDSTVGNRLNNIHSLGGLYFCSLPTDYGSSPVVYTDTDFPISVLDSYDHSAFRYATKAHPVAVMMDEYLILKPELDKVFMMYDRVPRKSYQEGEERFASATQLTVTNEIWKINQWSGGLIFQADTNGVFTESDENIITSNIIATVTCTGASFNDAEDRKFRLFQTPDIHDLLLPAVMYQTALILENGDQGNGTWNNNLEASIKAFREGTTE